jgi:hypothetical protein
MPQNLLEFWKIKMRPPKRAHKNANSDGRQTNSRQKQKLLSISNLTEFAFLTNSKI